MFGIMDHSHRHHIEEDGGQFKGFAVVGGKFGGLYPLISFLRMFSMHVNTVRIERCLVEFLS